MINLNTFARIAHRVAIASQENGAKVDTSTLGMLKHCAAEVVKTTKAYKYLNSLSKTTTPDSPEYSKAWESFEEELADVITCCLIVAAEHDIDIEAALERC